MSKIKQDVSSNRPVGSDMVEAVLAGLLENLPDKQSSVVRIFLSSTFTGNYKAAFFFFSFNSLPGEFLKWNNPPFIIIFRDIRFAM